MAADIHTGRNGKSGRRVRHRALAEINVTPFVDVMLVLLIVFMVTAPLLYPMVPVDLPKTKAKTSSQDREPLAITIKRDGSIFLQNTQVGEEELVPKLAAIAENNRDLRILVRGDKSVDYGRVMRVMGGLSAAGFTRIGLVTDKATLKVDAK